MDTRGRGVKRIGEHLLELLVMALLLVPGLALMMCGLKLLRWEGSPGWGLAMVALGIAMIAGGGYYHYRKDYAGDKRGRGALVRFAAVSLLSAVAGLAASGTLFRLIGR